MIPTRIAVALFENGLKRRAFEAMRGGCGVANRLLTSPSPKSPSMSVTRLNTEGVSLGDTGLILAFKDEAMIPTENIAKVRRRARMSGLSGPQNEGVPRG